MKIDSILTRLYTAISLLFYLDEYYIIYYYNNVMVDQPISFCIYNNRNAYKFYHPNFKHMKAQNDMYHYGENIYEPPMVGGY